MPKETTKRGKGGKVEKRKSKKGMFFLMSNTVARHRRSLSYILT
jgi:hypothetical protein